MRCLTKDEVIKLLRKKQNGRSAAELARELGISPPHISDIFHGRRDPGDETLRTLGLRRVIHYESAGN